jgi:hypothetical protein
MKVRKPDYNFTHTDPAWCKEHPEFAQRTNLGSLSLPYLEPYLNLVMRQAQAKLGPEHPLNRDIGLFLQAGGESLPAAWRLQRNDASGGIREDR